MYETDFQSVVGSEETILWQGRPEKKCFIVESIFNPLLPFALFWAAIDLTIIGTLFFSKVHFENVTSETAIILIFFLVHMMPVWIYLIGIFRSIRSHRNVEYIVTDRAIYISGGANQYYYEKKTYQELEGVTLNQGYFDKRLGVADVEFKKVKDKEGKLLQSNLTGFAICDVSDYDRVYHLVKEFYEKAKA
ncbi:MAG: PH domain-containing protein [Lachnospiraceae bacterium]|nr:PH domain-containing protein [Lachnospiraceae bacterium]MBR4605248.1 PH domain-containing protein [Lachnospiraceae bacterium]